MQKPENAKERNLIKGAIRRIFSRSELRQSIINRYTVDHFDPNRPRVTKWVYCAECGLIFPRYLAEVDHNQPIIPLQAKLEDLTWDDVIDAIWCDEYNLRVMDKECHKIKTKEENKIRRDFKKART